MSIEPPAVAILSVDTEPTYVVGFPAYVATTIACQPRDATLTRVPVIGWQGTRGMVGLTLKDETSNAPVVQIDPLPVADPDLGVAVSRLEAGEPRRFLIDLAEMLPDALPPGAYRGSLTFGPEAIRSDAAPLRIAFRMRSPQEEDQRKLVFGERDRRGSWGMWTRMPLLDSPLRVPRGAEDPLRLNLVLGILFHAPMPLAQVPFALLDCLTGVFEPEREALHAELLAARGEEAALVRQVAAVKARFPALTRWMNQLLSGESEIAWSRKVERP